MKTKLLALAFSMASLWGNALNGEPGNDPEGPIHTLEPFVVVPHKVKLLNDQTLKPVDFSELIRSDVEKIIEDYRAINTATQIAFQMKVIKDLPLVAAARQ